MRDLKYLLLSVALVTAVFWSGNAGEKLHALFNVTPYDHCVYGTEKYLNKTQEDITTIHWNGQILPVGWFKLGGRWCQVRFWFAKIGLSKAVVEQLAKVMLFAGATIESILALLFIMVLIISTFKAFPYRLFSLGCLASIWFFTALLIVDIALAGDRLEVFEHSLYIGLFCVFFIISLLAKERNPLFSPHSKLQLT